MTDRLEGAVVFVTGAARGIGAELARVLAARGARLALAGLEPDRLAALGRELGAGHAWFPCDVTDQAALDAAVSGAVGELGGIDVVVANAGIACHGTVAVAPVEAMARVIEVNLVGVVRTVSATLRHVIGRRGYYLLVSSAAAIAPSPGLAAYAAAKSGVEHFGSALRLELGHKGVTVGVAHPSWIDTDLVRDARGDFSTFERMIRGLPGPLGRVTPVRECAEVLARAIEKRRRKVYVPASLAAVAFLRQLFASRLADRLTLRRLRRYLPAMEAEAAALGRAFGENSAEILGRPPYSA